MDTKKFNLIRGPRIIQQMLAEAATYNELERNTVNFVPPSTKRQHAVDPIQIQQLELIPAKQSGQLIVKSIAKSGFKAYEPTMVFENVQFEDEDSPQNITFRGVDGQDYHIRSISLHSNNVKVRCTCLDFRWRFAVQNQQRNALFGPGPGIYQRKIGSNRPPNNPQHVPGLCKHLLALAEELRNSRIVTF